MPDNLVTTATVSTVPVGTRIATYKILSHSGEEADIAPVVIGVTALAEGSRTFTPVDSSNPLPVSIASLPSVAVTNAGTFATQVTSISAGDNNIGNVDVVSLPALVAGTANIGDVDVLTLPSIPAGNNNIGDVDIASGTLTTVTTVSTVTNLATIGTSVTPGTSAAHLGKAVDAPVGASDTGIAALYQRVDSPATLTPAVNDYTRASVDSMGRQWAQTGGGMATGTLANVSGSASNVTLMAANAARKGFVIFNDSTSILYVKCAATASATSWTWRLQAGESVERIGPCYTGIIDGIWVSATGTARNTEFT